MCIFTFTQLGEDQELGLSGVGLLLTDGGCRAELNHVGMTWQLFLHSKQVKEHTEKPSLVVNSEYKAEISNHPLVTNSAIHFDA